GAALEGAWKCLATVETPRGASLKRRYRLCSPRRSAVALCQWDRPLRLGDAPRGVSTMAAAELPLSKHPLGLRGGGGHRPRSVTAAKKGGSRGAFPVRSPAWTINCQ